MDYWLHRSLRLEQIDEQIQGKHTERGHRLLARSSLRQQQIQRKDIELRPDWRIYKGTNNPRSHDTADSPLRSGSMRLCKAAVLNHIARRGTSHSYEDLETPATRGDHSRGRTRLPEVKNETWTTGSTVTRARVQIDEQIQGEDAERSTDYRLHRSLS